MIEKTIIFYSGKLWYSEKPYPINVFSDTIPDGSSEMFNNAVKTWLSTAYEVTETNLTLEYKKRILNHNNISCGEGAGWEIAQAWDTKAMFDGDQITLLEGYGIEYILPDRINGFTKTATITLPEKDKYEVWFNDEWNVVSESQYLSMINNNKYGRINGVLENGDPEKPQIIGVKIKPDVEPSESQEETPAVPWRIEVRPKGWGPSTVMFDANDNCVMYEHSPNITIWTIIVDAVNQKYTRK